MKTYVPKGHRVLIKPKEVEEITKGGILIAKVIKDQEQQAQVEGEVLAVGLDAWKEMIEPWANVGDRVLYQRYAGMRVPDGRGGFRKDLLLINDLDITAVIIEDSGEEND